MIIKSVTDLPNKQDAVRGNSVPSPPFLLITTIFPSKGISKQLNLPCLANTKEKEKKNNLVTGVNFHRRKCNILQ